jgi:hypothetical protein
MANNYAMTRINDSINDRINDKNKDKYEIGDFVEVRWPDEYGEYYSSRIEMEKNGEYGVKYYDGSFEGPVTINRIRNPESNNNRFDFNPNDYEIIKTLETNKDKWDMFLDYTKKHAKLKGFTPMKVNNGQTCWLCLTPPWTLHYIFFAPCMWCPCAIIGNCFPSCYGYKNYELPTNANEIIEITTKGIIGNLIVNGEERIKSDWNTQSFSYFTGPKTSPRGSISWENFDINSVYIKKESNNHIEEGCYSTCNNQENMSILTNGPGITCGVGLLIPCAAYVYSNPKLDDSVYSVEIISKDKTKIISASALNISPNDLIETLLEYSKCSN